MRGYRRLEDGSILEVDAVTWSPGPRGQLDERVPLLPAALPYMVAQRSGSIINNSSIVAVLGAADQIAYSASKGGVLSMSRELAVQFARDGVRVNAICPGPVSTPLLEDYLTKEPAHAHATARPHPAGSVRQPGRGRRRRGLPRLGRVELHHRVSAHGRRRRIRAFTGPREAGPSRSARPVEAAAARIASRPTLPMPGRIHCARASHGAQMEGQAQ